MDRFEYHKELDRAAEALRAANTALNEAKVKADAARKAYRKALETLTAAVDADDFLNG